MALVPIQTAPQQPIARALLPSQADAGLVVASLNWKTAQDSLGTDYSANGNDGTVYGKPTSLRVGVSLDGTDDRIDFSDVGNIQQIGMWIKPGSTTEQIVFVDSGTYIHLVAGTVTYVNLTTSATYVDGVASTTLVAGRWQHLVCQFTQVDANNFELGWDGTNYGEIDVMDFTAYDALKTASWITLSYRRGVPDDSLVLWILNGDRDYSRYEHLLTAINGVSIGHGMEFDGVDDYLTGPAVTYIPAAHAGTIMFWMKGAIAGDGCMLRAGSAIYRIQHAGAAIAIDDYTTNNAADKYLVAGVFVANQWAHVVLTYTPTESWLYVNRVEIGHHPTLQGTTIAVAGLTIGRYAAATNMYDGVLKDYRIYDEAKSADWVADLYRKTRGFY